MQLPNAGVIKTRWWLDGGRYKRQVLGDVMMTPDDDAARSMSRLWRTAALQEMEHERLAVEQLMSAGGQEGPHMACLETADALQALLSLTPDTCCAMDRHNGSACESSLAAMDHIVREGFRVLTEPGAHADEIGARVQVAGWRRAFALAATLRGCVWL